MKCRVQMLSFPFPMAFAAAVFTQLLACSSNPHKAEKISTEIENKGSISGDTSVGVKDGNMVVQKRVEMNEELRRMQIEVYELEDKVYGNRKFGSLGLYGVLRECRAQLSDPKLGGDGKMRWTEPMDRVSDREEEYQVGLDEKDNLVGVSEEFLKDRIERFKKYKVTLMKRQDDFDERLQICKTELKSQMSARQNTNQ